MSRRKQKRPRPHRIVRERLEKAIRHNQRHLSSSVLLRKRDLPEQPRFCRWCGKEPKPPRRTWCSQECVDEYLVRSSSHDARRLAYDRDAGVCAVCGIDAEEVGQLRLRCVIMATPEAREQALRPDETYSQRENRLYRLEEEFRAQWGPWWAYVHAGWEVDHIVPVILGGGCCGLDNLRTLCLRCHKEETAELAASRARENRIRKTGQIEMKLE